MSCSSHRDIAGVDCCFFQYIDTSKMIRRSNVKPEIVAISAHYSKKVSVVVNWVPLIHQPNTFEMAGTMRKLPNILVSGTPGTGKSTLCKKLAKKVQGLTVVDFGKEAKAYDCQDEYDDALDCWIIDEEKVRRHPARCHSLRETMR